MKALSVIRRARQKLIVQKTLFGKFAFIHINKCGGTSVEAALGLPKIHDTALQRRQKIGAKRWERIPSFALVRSPYSKVASHYRYRVKTNQTGLGVNSLDLNEWVRAAYGEKNPRYYDKPLMFAPCVDWISDESGKIIVSLVLRLEEINATWHKVEELIGRPTALPKANSTSLHLGSTEKDLDKQSIAIINNHFRADFLIFGYEQR